MNKKKFKPYLPIMGLFLILLAFSFFFGALAYKYKLHDKVLSSLNKEDYSYSLYPSPAYNNPEPIFSKQDIQYPFTFIVVGDSREPAGYEKDLIIKQIISEKPDFVIHTGDLVQHGQEHDWLIFDAFEGEIIKNNISIYPAPGNHEFNKYYNKKNSKITLEEMLAPYFERFKFLENRRWYSFSYGNSLFLFLDSNTDYLGGSPQYTWLLDRLKENSAGFLFISLHHPLYTGYVEGHPVRDSEKFLAEFLENYTNTRLSKPDIVFSGHIHNYERYNHSNISYVVTGGGGAPQHIFERDINDLYKEPAGETYNYCKLKVYEDKITFEMIKLNKDKSAFEIKDTFTISK